MRVSVSQTYIKHARISILRRRRLASSFSVNMETKTDEIVACESSEDDTSDNENEQELLEICPVTEDILKSLLAHLHSQNVQFLSFDTRKAEEFGRTNRVRTQRTQNWATKLHYKHLSDGDTQTLDIVLKFLPTDPFDKYYVTDAGFDLREISFYTEVLRDLRHFCKDLQASESLEFIPECLYTSYTDGNLGNDGSVLKAPESLLVVENVGAQGYTRSNFSEGLNLKETECAIRALAHIHALLLSYKIKCNIDLKTKYTLFDIRKVTETYQVSVERGWPHIISFLEHTPCMENELQALRSIQEYSQTLIEDLLMPQEPLAVLTHTDFWGNNLRFKQNSKQKDMLKCKILDWQMVTYSRPSNDLALLLISSVKTEVRREHHDQLIHYYFENLSQICNNLGLNLQSDLSYGYKEFQEEYHKSQLLALLLCVGCIDIALGDPVAEKRLIQVLIDLYNDGILDERCSS